VTRVEQRVAELLKSVTPTFDAVAVEDVARRVRRQRSVRWSVVGSVAAVAAVAVAGALAENAGHRSHSPTPSVDLSGTIPWVDAPARPYQPPTVSSTPPPSDARPCTAADVAARFGAGSGAGGHLETLVVFRNIGTSTCVLKGYPQVVATEPGLPDVAATDGSFFSGGSTANMQRGQQTLLGLETDTYCAARPGGGGGGRSYHHLDITLPGGGTVSLDRAAGFDLTCGLHLTKFFVQQPVQAAPHDPLSDLQVSLETPATVSAGDTLIYVADLSNPTDQPISLDRCPGYVETARPMSTPVKEVYALNCDSVAVIAARQTVRFEMRMRIPSDTSPGTLTVFWALAGPEEGSGSATVSVPANPTPTQS
jgi:hypothetical protein